MSSKEIWVYPELFSQSNDSDKLVGGLLTEARCIADRIGGQSAALIFRKTKEKSLDLLKRYGIQHAYIFRDDSLEEFSAELYSAAISETVKSKKPWLILMGATVAGRELIARLSVSLETGTVTNCVKMDFDNLECPVFFRPAMGDQVYQEIVFQKPELMLVTLKPEILNDIPVKEPTNITIIDVDPNIGQIQRRINHLGFMLADFNSVDIADAETIVSVGSGAATDELLPLVKELADLLEGAIGTTRPVADVGKIDKNRMIGQTGKIVNPELYLALGISGASHHVGGIQDSKKIVSVNKDPQAPIFQNSDIGAVADLKDILPRLIEKIKKSQ